LDGTTHARLGMAIGKSTIAKTSVSSKAKHKASNLPPADLKNCSAACRYLVPPSFARPFTSSFVKETCIRYLGMGNPPFKVRLNDVSVYSVKLETSAACPKAPADVSPYLRARSNGYRLGLLSSSKRWWQWIDNPCPAAGLVWLIRLDI
jgi:hypothetical protein